jgi:hypothetical protein
VNYDTHGDGSGQKVSYEQGRGVPDQAGELAPPSLETTAGSGAIEPMRRSPSRCARLATMPR